MSDATPASASPRIARRPHRLGAHAAALVGASTVALAACAKVGEDVFNHETAPFDEPIRDWVLRHQHAALRRAYLVVTRTGSPSATIPMTALLAAWLWRRRGMPIAGAVVLAPAAATALFLAVKHIYRRQRPAGAAQLRERTFSFPSGHATAAAAIFPTLAYVLWRECLMRGDRAIALGTVAPLMIGTSRVYLDVHWPTDVLGGWSAGAGVAAMSAGVYEHVRRTTRERGEPVMPQRP
ncbi:MAG: phosphatase PAP2 family protein [Gemmatimonadaceae bacterium]